MHGGYSEVYGQSVQMKLCTSSIHIDIIHNHANLPVVHDSYVSEKAKRGLGPIMQSGLCQACLSALDFFGGLTVLSHPLLTMQNQTAFPVSPVLVIQQKKI